VERAGGRLRNLIGPQLTTHILIHNGSLYVRCRRTIEAEPENLGGSGTEHEFPSMSPSEDGSKQNAGVRLTNRTENASRLLQYVQAINIAIISIAISVPF
jgi:hypothetical protein